MNTRASVGVVGPYWDFWEDAVEVDIRSAKKTLHERCTAEIAALSEVVWNVSDADLDDGLADVDVIVVVVQMAAPPQIVQEFLKNRPGTVKLIWAAHDTPRVEEPFTHESIVIRGATVGASMLAASLFNEGISYDLALGEPGSASVAQALKSALAAGSVRGARLSVIGGALAGYDFVTSPESELSRLGIELVRHSPGEFAQRAQEVRPAALSEYLRSVDQSWHESTTPDGSEKAVRYALALEELVNADGSVAGTLNCHVAELRKDPLGPGVAPCFGLGRETSAGRPWTCTGDINTSLAMLFVAALGHPTFYHEMEAVDVTTGEVILANSGEHDTRFVNPESLRFTSNPWYPGPHPTPIVRFQIEPGPATIVAMSAASGRFRAIVAEGEFTSRSAEPTGTMSAVFRFSHLVGSKGWEKWAQAGSSHHSCATNAHIAQDIERLCKHLDIEFIQI